MHGAVGVFKIEEMGTGFLRYPTRDGGLATLPRPKNRYDGVVLQAQPNLGNQARSMNRPRGHGLHFERWMLKMQGHGGWTRRVALREPVRSPKSC